MGKYVQDLRFVVKALAEQKELSEALRSTVNTASFLGDIFTYYLPRKYEIGNNIWRIIISLTPDKLINGNVFNDGLGVVTCYIYYDYTQLISVDDFERKQILLEIFFNGLKLVIKKYDSTYGPLEEIKQKLIEDKIVFNTFYKPGKLSPNKKHFAQMKGFYSEVYEDRKLFVVVSDKHKTELQTILVGYYNFQAFDNLKWLNNTTICVYHINTIQSYKRKKVAADYFSIDIEKEIVTYHPITRESMFDYGVKLLTELNLYDEALHYIMSAQKMGHGKADNILKNLELEPTLRDKEKLLQTPKHKKQK